MDSGPEELLVTRIFRVVRHREIGPDGREHTKVTVQHPGAVTILPILDDGRVCFQVEAKADLKTPPGEAGPMLFLDVDSDPKTGWLGYDFVVGRKPAGAGRAVLERNNWTDSYLAGDDFAQFLDEEQANVDTIIEELGL